MTAVARIVKPKWDYHTIRARSDRNDGELTISGKGMHCYLWVGADATSESRVQTFSGRNMLRSLALQILKQVGRHREKKHAK